jgi:hypothetical protein
VGSDFYRCQGGVDLVACGAGAEGDAPGIGTGLEKAASFFS